MKSRDPKTGEVFEDIMLAHKKYNCCDRTCSECVIPNLHNGKSETVCNEWVTDHPAEAARLMGYDIIEEDQMEKMDKLQANQFRSPTKMMEESAMSQANQTEQSTKPRICEVLGVDVGEKFELGSTGIVLLVNNDGKIHVALSGGTSKETDLNVNYLVDAYNNDRIIRKPRFTEEEVADMAAIRRLFKVKEVGRRRDGVLYAGHYNEDCARFTNGLSVFYLPQKLLPSLRPGQSVALEDIIKEATP